MMNTETTCQGWRCEDPATTERTRDDGTTFACCDEHARGFDAHQRRTAGYSPAFLAEMEAEGRAERELEGRVS
jgi:hypothetical protein